MCGDFSKHECKSGALRGFNCFTSSNYLNIQQQQMFAFFILYQRWANKYREMLNIAFLRRRRHFHLVRYRRALHMDYSSPRLIVARNTLQRPHSSTRVLSTAIINSYLSGPVNIREHFRNNTPYLEPEIREAKHAIQEFVYLE